MSEVNAAKTGWKFRHVLLAVILALGIPAAVVGIVEASLRIADVGYRPDLLTPCTVQGQPASCYNLFFAAPFFPPGMIQTPRPYFIPAQKGANTYRIFVLGESAAMGDPDPAYGFSRYLEVMLRERYPEMRFEVINTGSVAINSHVLLPMAEQLARQKPDLFIIYSGNNEIVGPYGPGTTLASSWAMQLPIIHASMFLHSTRTGQLITKLSTPKQTWRGMELFLDKQIPADAPLLQYAYSNFESNLRDTVYAAKKAGAKVIVSTVATNVRDCAPFASMHKKNLAPDAMSSWSQALRRGEELENAASYPEALKQYEQAEAIDPGYAELQFRIARAYWKAGDYDHAREAFLRARDLDVLRFRADGKINDINRRVAASVSGVDLVDAEAILENQSEHRTIGSEMVYEHVHLTPEGNYQLARAMFARIAAMLPPAATADPAPLTQSECEQRLGLTRSDRARIAADMLGRIQKPPFTTQINHNEQVERLIALSQQADEYPSQTLEQYQWALTRWPDDRMLHYRFGMFLFPYNRAAAAQQLLMAQPWDGFPVLLPDGTQIR
jgi:tetratricopeptide (TPR) repeat protein